MRGRDIKKYTAEFADIYLITTLPSLNIDISKYPAVEKYLLTFGKKRLEQSGEPNSRKKTNNKWFETQDAISYWNDFDKPKIIWKIIGNQMAFAIDLKQYMLNNACYILTGNNLKYLLSVLNSKLITWYSIITNMNKTGVGDVQVGKQNIILFPIPILSASNQIPFIKLVDMILKNSYDKENIVRVETELSELVFNLYNLTKEEAFFIQNVTL